jgi:hypothetical protein
MRKDFFMSHPAFDAAGFVKFDLESGSIRSPGDESLALVPVDVVSMLEPSADLDRAARSWGEIHGKRLADVLAQSDSPSTVDLLTDYLGGSLTVVGLGRIHIEIRGDALMFRVKSDDGSPGTAGRRALLAGFLAGYLGALGPAGFGVVHVDSDEGGDLFWAGSPQAAQRVQTWLMEGMAPMTALDRLTEGGGP